MYGVRHALKGIKTVVMLINETGVQIELKSERGHIEGINQKCLSRGAAKTMFERSDDYPKGKVWAEQCETPALFLNAGLKGRRSRIKTE